MMYLIDDLHTAPNDGDHSIIDCTLDVNGRPLQLSIAVQAGPARLSDIVPLAQAVSDRLCGGVIESLSDDDCQVPCRKGCCCCCDYLVSLSMPEVYFLQLEMERWDADRRHAVLSDCLVAANKILSADNLSRYQIADGGNLAEINAWYGTLGVSCPFLTGDSCSIYGIRPLACREHLVTSPPQFCKPGQAQDGELVTMPVSILEALARLAGGLEETEQEAVLLPLVPVCTDCYRHRCRRTWPAVTLVQTFVDILESMTLDVSGAGVSSKHDAT